MPETELQKTETMIEISPDNLDELLDKEWLITNNRAVIPLGRYWAVIHAGIMGC